MVTVIFINHFSITIPNNYFLITIIILSISYYIYRAFIFKNILLATKIINQVSQLKLLPSQTVLQSSLSLDYKDRFIVTRIFISTYYNHHHVNHEKSFIGDFIVPIIDVITNSQIKYYSLQ